MCDRRKLLLAFFVVFYYEVTAGSATVLDMAPDSVDYIYNGCQKEAMEKLIHSDLLKQELNTNEGFKKAWNANAPCLKLIPGVTKEHKAALLAYADGDEDFTNTFDNAVETMGGNISTYEKHFHFKSLHFLLMDSMRLMSTKKCETLRVLKKKKQYTAQKGSKVRLGKFTKGQTSYGVQRAMDDLDGLVIFNITSCFFVNLGENICNQNQGIALLSPAEVFTVEAVNTIADDDESNYIEIVLKHLELDRSHNCYSVSGSPADVSTQWFVLMLVALAAFSFNY